MEAQRPKRGGNKTASHSKDEAKKSNTAAPTADTKKELTEVSSSQTQQDAKLPPKQDRKSSTNTDTVSKHRSTRKKKKSGTHSKGNTKSSNKTQDADIKRKKSPEISSLANTVSDIKKESSEEHPLEMLLDNNEEELEQPVIMQVRLTFVNRFFNTITDIDPVRIRRFVRETNRYLISQCDQRIRHEVSTFAGTVVSPLRRAARLIAAAIGSICLYLTVMNTDKDALNWYFSMLKSDETKEFFQSTLRELLDYDCDDLQIKVTKASPDELFYMQTWNAARQQHSRDYILEHTEKITTPDDVYRRLKQELVEQSDLLGRASCEGKISIFKVVQEELSTLKKVPSLQPLQASGFSVYCAGKEAETKHFEDRIFQIHSVLNNLLGRGTKEVYFRQEADRLNIPITKVREDTCSRRITKEHDRRLLINDVVQVLTQFARISVRDDTTKWYSVLKISNDTLSKFTAFLAYVDENLATGFPTNYHQEKNITIHFSSEFANIATVSLLTVELSMRHRRRSGGRQTFYTCCRHWTITIKFDQHTDASLLSPNISSPKTSMFERGSASVSAPIRDVVRSNVTARLTKEKNISSIKVNVMELECIVMRYITDVIRNVCDIIRDSDNAMSDEFEDFHYIVRHRSVRSSKACKSILGIAKKIIRIAETTPVHSITDAEAIAYLSSVIERTEELCSVVDDIELAFANVYECFVKKKSKKAIFEATESGRRVTRRGREIIYSLQQEPRISEYLRLHRPDLDFN